MTQNDPYNLQPFVEAQHRCYEQVRDELRAGRKSSHWWFVFPQWKGLGHTPIANLYAIASRPEAEAYLAHPVLGPRLMECTRLVNSVKGRTVEQIFGHPDDLKFRSSMTPGKGHSDTPKRQLTLSLTSVCLGAGLPQKPGRGSRPPRAYLAKMQPKISPRRRYGSSLIDTPRTLVVG
jgi:uncharacterized protein (DUF1810 family)